MRIDKGKTRTTLISFMKKVYPEPNTGCWLWGGKINQDGYGRTLTKHLKLYNAHRLSYYLHNGDFDMKLYVLHKCDMPSCVNPDHLYLGDQLQNMKDREDRKRGAPHFGEFNNKSKLTEHDVLEIRSAYKPYQFYFKEKMAEKYGVSIYTIYEIVSRQTWTHI